MERRLEKEETNGRMEKEESNGRMERWRGG